VRFVAQRVRAVVATGKRPALLACASLLLLSACGVASADHPVSLKPVDVIPKGAVVVPGTTTTTSPAGNCGDPTASLPPPTTMPTPGNMPTGSYMARILERGYLRVGVDQNTYLWGYRDPATGSLTGFDISMLQQVAQAIFGAPGHIRYVIVPNATRAQAVQSGLVDIVAETMTITCTREKLVDFSTVYYEAGQQILVPTNSDITGKQDLTGKRVCAPAGSTSLQNLAALHEHIQLWAVNNETDCLVMMEQGQVDAISTDDAILQGLRAQDPNTQLVGQTFSSEPYGMAISKAHPDFTSFVNGVLAQVRANNTWTSIYDSNIFAVTGIPAPALPAPRYR
jgi:polar amino acid transport system substrate-binding protein